ncbi:type VII secretion protein EccB [Mycobacterium sp. Y57]|uniref:type VII secretion protein EccB n=1 Tax=Mycolicibacterium xanthum TaxID=2796469 RepID=UPI001C8526E5|nr:type VII secretion protein EccB [Mycolicibacterium xanthum]MBX7432176.1 type VII secretion protein EccB [Mycolicibacterium xanthum]
MAGYPTTRLQVSGHRFLARRMAHALVRGDARMLDDPLRAQSISLATGAVLAVLAVAVCAGLALLRPAGELGDDPVLLVGETGAMFVRIEGTLHPVPNLASARLITGAPVQPRIVSGEAVARADRGPGVGIPGAPGQLGAPLGLADAQWTVCDDVRSGTAVIAGAPRPGVVGPGDALLVTPLGASPATTYLLYDGWRARVDLRHAAVVRALRLDGVTPRPVSPALLTAIPEVPPIVAPLLPADATVVAVPRAGGEDYFLVFADGVQRIGEVVADLIRFTDSRIGEVPRVAPDDIGSRPVVDHLPVQTYPRRGGVGTAPVVCARWRPDDGGTVADTEILTGTRMPTVATPVRLAQADELGPAIDLVSVPAGRSVFVRSVGLTGGGRSAGSLFLVTDSGVRFGVRNDDAAAALGLPGPATLAPWPVLDTLPAGPELSRDAASVLRDALSP